MKWRNTYFTEVNDSSPVESYARNSARHQRDFFIWGFSPGGAQRELTRQMRAQAAEDFLGANVLFQPFGTATKYISRLTPFAVPLQKTNFNSVASATVFQSNYYATAIPRMSLLPAGAGYGLPKSNNPADNYLGGGGAGSTGTAQGPVARAEMHFDAVPWRVAEDADVLATSPPVGGTASPIIGFPDEGDALRTGGVTGTRYITRWIDYGGRLITLTDPHVAGGAGAVVWTVDPADTGGSPTGVRGIFIGQPFNEPSLVVHYIWRQVPAAARPQKAIQAGLGRVNECMFDSWQGGCLLFVSAKEEFYENHLGTLEYEYDYAFKFLPHQRRFPLNNPANPYLGHNSILHRRADGTIDYALMDTFNDGTTAHPPLLSFDPCSLFRPDQ